MLGQHAPYDILINLDIEDQRNLIGNALVAKARVLRFVFTITEISYGEGQMGPDLPRVLAQTEGGTYVSPVFGASRELWRVSGQ